MILRLTNYACDDILLFWNAEFGFVVMGHEFDQYPKQMIRNVKNWNWFLEEPGKESDDCDESDREERRGGRRKRKKGEDNEDEKWTGDSEADEELVAKRKVNEPKYSTRSKAHNKPQKKAKDGKSSYQKKTAAADEEGIEDENEDDETLGGFIVGEDDLEEEEDPERTDEYEEEEEFVEEDDDDDEVDD